MKNEYSDPRLKTDISLITNPLNKLNAIHGYYYRGNALAGNYGFNTETVQVGLLTSEIVTVLPEIIEIAPFDASYDPTGEVSSLSGETYLTVQYDKVVPLLIEVARAQQVLIEQATQGIQGITTTQGLQGIQGTQGTQGVIGIQGVQGAQGTIGTQGIQGVQGVQGSLGIQGSIGAGVQGAQGTIGSTGAQGIQGITGIQGTAGNAGTGIQGAQGTIGSTGAQGIQGITGITGGFTTGSNAQVNSLGVNTAASGTAGEIRATNNVIAYYSSDRRLKENIVPICNALEKLGTITGVNFDWTQEHINSSGGEDSMFLRKNTVGIIAQEIEKILPEAVADRPDGFKAVRYELIIPLLIQAINELNSKVDSLHK